jgi:hypothetical protein
MLGMAFGFGAFEAKSELVILVALRMPEPDICRRAGSRLVREGDISRFTGICSWTCELAVITFLLYVTPMSVNIRVQFFIDLGHRETLHEFGELIQIELRALPNGLVVSTACLINRDTGISGTAVLVYVV